MKKLLASVVRAPTMPAPISVDLNPVAAKTRLAMNFVVIAPIAPAKVIMPD
ncbi:hypothetical protein D3C87_1910640 [compost metagenome]